MKQRNIGRFVVRLVNRHWLLFGVLAEPPWGFLIGFWIAHTFRNSLWGWFAISIVCTLVWGTALFMKAYTDKENRK